MGTAAQMNTIASPSCFSMPQTYEGIVKRLGKYGELEIIRIFQIFIDGGGGNMIQ
jgi:hypothetical protein